MPEDLERFKYRIQYDFQNKRFLKEALTHRSYAVENDLDYDNQRLEFLGDAVLEIAVTTYLFERYPAAAEGTLTKMRAALVQQDALARLARNLGLGDFLYIGKGESESGGAQRDSTLADLFEAVLGAYYLDAGGTAATAFAKAQVLAEFPAPHRLLVHQNPKGALQEYTQYHWNIIPEYAVLSVQGPEHSPQYEVQVTVRELTATGCGGNRRHAESAAASALIEQIARKDPSIEEFGFSAEDLKLQKEPGL